MKPPTDNAWIAAAKALPPTLSVSCWPERVRTWLDRSVRSDEPWCVALSGGADSVALLLMLVREARPESVVGSGVPVANVGRRLVALHFNHRLRGAAADADEVFCRELCAALEVELLVGGADWPVGLDVSEGRAREARFAFFNREMGALGARALWLGHHRDDVVETMLLRLSRGSGARGLAAPRPVQCMADGTVRLRPLLDLAKAEIVAALRSVDANWCEDASNQGEAYFRNRLRQRVVPAWREVTPVDLAGSVARSRALLEEEDDALELWVDRVLPETLGSELALGELRAAPIAVVRRALYRWLGALGLGAVFSSAGFDELLATVRDGRSGRFSVGEAGFVEAMAERLALVAPLAPAPQWAGARMPVPGEVRLADGARVLAELRPLDATLLRRIEAGALDDGFTAFLAAEETRPDFLIRHWQPGDRYRPLGAVCATKLQDQFVNRRIARELRQRLPVVCNGAGAILWVPGLPPAHESRVAKGTTLAVQLTYRPADSQSASSHG